MRISCRRYAHDVCYGLDMSEKESSTPERLDESSPRKPATTERLNMNLVALAHAALLRLMARNGMSKTDAVNRALQVYDYLDTRVAEGHEILLRSPRGHVERLKIF